MENVPVEATKNPSDDFLLLEPDDKNYSSKELKEDIPYVLETGDGITSLVVEEETVHSQESFESILSCSENDGGTNVENKKYFIRNEKCALFADFVRKVWTAFLTFQVFVIPAITGLIIGTLSKYENPGNGDPYQDVMYSVMMGFLGAAVLVGLPFHMIALADLEDTVNDIMLSQIVDSVAIDDSEDVAEDTFELLQAL